jgi:hypothetical protein
LSCCREMAVQRSSTLVQQRQTYSMSGKSMALGSGSSRRFAAAAADSLAPVQCQQVLPAWSVASWTVGRTCQQVSRLLYWLLGSNQHTPLAMAVVVEATACVTNGMHASDVHVCWHGCVVPIYKRMCCYGCLRHYAILADTYTCLQVHCLCGGLQHGLCFTVPAECRQRRQSDQLKDCWQSAKV